MPLPENIKQSSVPTYPKLADFVDAITQAEAELNLAEKGQSPAVLSPAYEASQGLLTKIENRNKELKSLLKIELHEEELNDAKFSKANEEYEQAQKTYNNLNEGIA